MYAEKLWLVKHVLQLSLHTQSHMHGPLPKIQDGPSSFADKVEGTDSEKPWMWLFELIHALHSEINFKKHNNVTENVKVFYMK